MGTTLDVYCLRRQRGGVEGPDDPHGDGGPQRRTPPPCRGSEPAPPPAATRRRRTCATAAAVTGPPYPAAREAAHGARRTRRPCGRAAAPPRVRLPAPGWRRAPGPGGPRPLKEGFEAIDVEGGAAAHPAWQREGVGVGARAGEHREGTVPPWVEFTNATIRSLTAGTDEMVRAA